MEKQSLSKILSILWSSAMHAGIAISHVALWETRKQRMPKFSLAIRLPRHPAS